MSATDIAKATIREQTIAHMVLQGWEPIQAWPPSFGIQHETNGTITCLPAARYGRGIYPDDTTVQVVWHPPQVVRPKFDSVEWRVLDTNHLLMMLSCGQRHGVL